MLRCCLTAYFLFASVAFAAASQSPSGSSQPSQSQTPTTAPSPTPPVAAKSADAKDQPADKNSTQEAKKPKKVWTEDDISKVGGSISVVGDPSASGPARSNSKGSGAGSANSAQDNQADYYRKELRRLQTQLDAADKKIEDLRNFKAENSSASGGIDPHRGYYMTPIPDQIKQLEDKKKQIQGKMDILTDEARKKGIEPGQLR
jgi:hypothetical protein